MTSRPTTRAERDALRVAREAEQKRKWDLILKLDSEGMKRGDIAKEVGMSTAHLSIALCRMGRRRSLPKGQRKPRARTHRRVCVDCGKVEMVRSDHKHTTHCAACAFAITKFPAGHDPTNKGSRERSRPRKCKICGAEFWRSESYMTKRPRYAWGSYCSNTCKGIGSQSPGSRYSEVGKNYPSRRFGRRGRSRS